MKHQQEKKQKGVLWRVLFAIVILLMAAVLELGKHTLLGWILAAAAAVCFAALRAKKLACWFARSGPLYPARNGSRASGHGARCFWPLRRFSGSPGRPCGRFRPWPEKQAA